MTAAVPDTLLNALTAEHALVARRYLSATEEDTGAVTLAINAPRQPVQPPLKKGLLLEFLLALDDVRGESAVVQLDLRNEGLSGKALEQVFATAWFAGVRRLRLEGNTVSAKCLGVLAAGGISLVELDLSHVKVGTGVAKLSGLPHLATLRLSFAGIDAAATSMLASADLPALAELDLAGWGIYASVAKLNRDMRDGHFNPPTVTGAMAKALLQAPLSQTLVALTIEHVHFDRLACGMFGGANLRALQRLRLNETTLEDAAAVISGQLPELRHLERKGGFPGEALATATFLPHLEVLLVHGAELTEEQVCQVLGNTPRLRSVNLASAGLSRGAIDALVEHGAGLAELRLMWNGLDDDSIEALMAATWLPQLEVLGLSNNHFGSRGITAIAAANLSVRGLGLGGVQLDAAEIAPLWDAKWLSGIETLSIVQNRLDDDAVEGLLRMEAGTTVNAHGNIFSRDALARLVKHFGRNLRPGNQYMYKRGQPRAPQESTFGIGFRHFKPNAFTPKVVDVPTWAQGEGVTLVASEPVGPRYVAVEERDGQQQLVVLLGEGKTMPLGVSAQGLTLEGIKCAAGFSLDSAFVVAIPNSGLYVLNVYTGDPARVGDIGSKVDDLICDNVRVAVLHRDVDGQQRVDWYTGSPSAPSSFTKRGEATGLDGSFGAVAFEQQKFTLLVGPTPGEHGAVRFFALDEKLGMAPMGGFGSGFTMLGGFESGSIGSEGHGWRLDGLKAAAKRAFKRNGGS